MTKQIEPKFTDKQQHLIDNAHRFTSLKDAALDAEYSPETARNIKSILKQQPHVLNRIKQNYLAHNVLHLPGITTIENNIVNACKHIPNENDTDEERIVKKKEALDNAAKFKHTLKEIKQGAGVLGHDEPVRPKTQNITTIQQLMVIVNNTDMGAIPQDVEDAVVVGEGG